MGHGITVLCKNCQHEETYRLGIGMLYSSLEAVMDFAVDRRRRKKIREILSTHKPEIIEYSHKLYACPQCETAHERFYVKLSTFERLLYETEFTCSTCKSKLVEMDPDGIERCRCGKCGEKALESFLGVCWD